MLLSHKSNYSIFLTLPLSTYLGYTFSKHLQDSLYMSLIDRLDFFIHEFGHILFSIFGNELLTILGGSLLQVLIPLFVLIGFIVSRERFGVAFCLAWIGTNFFYISTYAGDAQKLELPLVGFSSNGEIIHDWRYILGHFGILPQTDFVAHIFYGIAILCYIAFFFYAGILMVNRFRNISED